MLSLRQVSVKDTLKSNMLFMPCPFKRPVHTIKKTLFFFFFFRFEIFIPSTIGVCKTFLVVILKESVSIVFTVNRFYGLGLCFSAERSSHCNVITMKDVMMFLSS